MMNKYKGINEIKDLIFNVDDTSDYYYTREFRCILILLKSIEDEMAYRDGISDLRLK